MVSPSSFRFRLAKSIEIMNKTEINQLEELAYKASYGKQDEVLKSWALGNGYTENISGDACQGDEVCCLLGRFGGSYKKPKLEGFSLLQGVITKDSYGAEKQQHTFTLELLDGTKKRIKGRNLYRYGTFAKPRSEAERSEALDEKHERGSSARACRDARRAQEIY